MVSCENKVYKLELGGYVGKRARAHEKAWLQQIFKRNPNLFGSFRDPEGNTLHKAQWHGEFPGKLLTGIAQYYRLYRDHETYRVGKEIVKNFAEVQWDDGYLGPWSREHRLDGDKDKWDTWGIYHCILGLYMWYKVTDDREALHIALRAADQLADYFSDGKHRYVDQNWVEMNFAVSHAFALLYRETGDEKYLRAAEYIVLEEWKTEYDDFFSKSRIACNWLEDALAGKAYYQTNQPRWEAQHTVQTLGLLYELTGKEDYLKAYDNLWKSIIKYDRRNFGGFGGGEGASGNVFSGGCETCNTVAWMGWTNEYLALTKDPSAADELELSYFNAAWGSLVDDVVYNYYNVMSGARIPATDILQGHGYEGGKDMSCCQANGARGTSQVAEWAILHSENNIYLNYYGAYRAETETPTGKKLTIEQNTTYPFGATVEIKLELDSPERFALCLRIPAWSKKTACKVCDKAVEARAGEYLVLDREWKSGDSITLELYMSLHYLEGERDALGKASVYRGPILLALAREREIEKKDDIGALEKSVGTYPAFKKSGLERGRLMGGEDFILKLEVLDDTGESETLVSYADIWRPGLEYETWLKVSD